MHQTKRYSILFRICLLFVAVALAAATIADAAEAQTRTISVSGTGEVRAEPDRALITLGVEARRPRMEDARNEVARIVESVLKLTRDLRIDQQYVQATRISVQPEYNWENQTRERTLIGYYVARQVQVELRNLDQLGTLLEQAIDLGVNQIGDPQLDSSVKRDLEREALARAVEDARLNAEAVAKAAGVRLGSARTITASNVSAPQPVAFRAMAMAEAAPGGGAPYQSGQMTFTANVQVEFDVMD